MLKDAIDRLMELAADGSAVRFEHFPGEPADCLWQIGPLGKVERLRLAPPKRVLQVARFADLAALALSPIDVDAANRMALFVDFDKATLLWDTRDGLEYAQRRLARTQEYRAFTSMLSGDSGRKFDVRGFVSLLRFVLCDTGYSPILLDKASTLNVRGGSASGNTYTRGAESMGKSIEAAVAQPADLPEARQEFMVRMFVGEELPWRDSLECFLEVDPATAQWVMWPREASWMDYHAQQLKHLVDLALRSVAEIPGVPVFLGSFETVTRDSPK